MKISELKLFTSNIEQQKEFYTQTLGLNLLNDNINSFSAKVGSSILTFIEGKENSCYHFAINIPSNQIKESLNWIKERVEVLKFEDQEIANFSNWNSEAIYFYDYDKNIVEFIARKNLYIDSHENFTEKSLLQISEIGMPVDDVLKTFENLNWNFNLKKYDGDYERFCAMGDENGLFVVVNYNEKKWFPQMDEARPFPFEIIFENTEGQIFKLIYEDETIKNTNYSTTDENVMYVI